MEASAAEVHLDETHSPGAEKAAWRPWVEVQCAYHEGEYTSAVKLLQRLLQRQQQAEAAAAAAAAAPFGAPAAQRQGGGGRCSELLAAVVPLPTAAQVCFVCAFWCQHLLLVESLDRRGDRRRAILPHNPYFCL